MCAPAYSYQIILQALLSPLLHKDNHPVDARQDNKCPSRPPNVNLWN